MILKAQRDRIKTVWLREIREYAKDHGENEESNSDEVASPPATPKTDQSSFEEAKPQPKLAGELYRGCLIIKVESCRICSKNLQATYLNYTGCPKKV